MGQKVLKLQGHRGGSSVSFLIRMFCGREFKKKKKKNGEKKKKKTNLMYVNFKRTKCCKRIHTIYKIGHFSACTFILYIKIKLELRFSLTLNK